jgi:MFS family permease
MARLDRTQGGLRIYAQKLKLFTPNARKVLLYSGLTGLTFGVFRLLFNFYVLSLGGYDEQFLGLLTSISSLASLMMAIPAAYLANRFSHKHIMVITGLISTSAFVGFVLLPYRPFLILFNVVSGLAMSARQVTVAPFLMDNTSPDERQYVFSFNFGMMTTAEFVGNMLGGFLPTWLGGIVGAMPTDTLAYQLALGSMIIVSMLAIGPLLLIRPSAADAVRKVEMPWTQLQQHAGKLTKLLTPNFIIGLGAGLMMPFMNVYYRHVFGRSDSTIGTLFAMGALTMAIAQFLAPPIADRLGKINTVVVTQALSVPFLLTLGLAAWIVPGGRANPPLWFAIAAVAYLFRLALMNLSGPVYQTFILESVQPGLQALAAGLNSVSFQFGWAFSPYLSGWFQTTYGEFGFVPVFLTTSFLYIVAIAVTWVFFHHAEGPPVSARSSEAKTVTTR